MLGLGRLLGLGPTPNPEKYGYEFKMLHTFENRKNESTRIMEKYQDRIPIIVERSRKSSVPDISKHKYLMPRDATIGQLMQEIRRKIKLGPSEGIFLFVDNVVMPNIHELISQVYEKYADQDGFLYITYAQENSFG